jgi:hypothetical protein
MFYNCMALEDGRILDLNLQQATPNRSAGPLGCGLKEADELTDPAGNRRWVLAANDSKRANRSGTVLAP